MRLTNTRAAYGWIAIALHWISAAGVIALYFLGDNVEEAPDRAAKLAAEQTHVSVGVLLFTFLAARVLWTLGNPKPEPLEKNRWFEWLAKVVQWLFLAMITALIITGPLSIWSMARPIAVFDWGSIPSPFAAPNRGLHELCESVHDLASKLFWPLIVLHVAGALKHLVFDRDRTFQRMLWVRRA